VRRDDPDAFEVDPEPPLPAPARVVIAALAPLLTERRRARIAAVVAARTRAVVPVLEDLTDPHNASAVMRSADAFGVQEIHAIDPERRLAASRGVARGTHRWLDIVRHVDAAACVAALRTRGYRIYVAAMDGETTPEELRAHPRVAVVLGNEHRGASPEIRALVDGTYQIPMAGFVESLNVSVAAAITLYVTTRGRHGDLGADEQAELEARFLMSSVRDAEKVVLEHVAKGPGV
jgi:tRNA (guanosine-2'-O-)-methyltransferase